MVAEMAIKRGTPRSMQDVIVWKWIKPTPPARKRRVGQNRAGSDSEGKTPQKVEEAVGVAC
jgi:hypothetical protein